MNFLFGFRVADRHDGRAKKAGRIETLLAVVIAGIFHRESRPVEYLLGVLEIKAVFFSGWSRAKNLALPHIVPPFSGAPAFGASTATAG